ncbi:hypothetical protein ACFFNY_01530 [Paenibacillus hodogayensis]|uniref:HTH araC/xylS-type domain-containing protein n=1 Tax=Paenibacillus hodogayensis TaxID=279208 RepID=A0ABV5VPN3_9BACL
METWLKHHHGNIDPFPNTPAIQRCISEMIHCTHLGTMKRLYMESKALEFIALFGESDGYGSVGGSVMLRHSDISKLQQARELVQKHFEQPLSIRELSKRVGLNEFKLKKGFRELFDMTIFELVRQIRMEKALWYMEVERLNVGETAFRSAIATSAISRRIFVSIMAAIQAIMSNVLASLIWSRTDKRRYSLAKNSKLFLDGQTRNKGKQRQSETVQHMRPKKRKMP